VSLQIAAPAVAIETLAGRADRVRSIRRDLKILRPERDLPLRLRKRLVRTRRLVASDVDKARIALPEHHRALARAPRSGVCRRPSLRPYSLESRPLSSSSSRSRCP